ncbi:MAG: hypothetical protein ABI650_03315 [Dokdonella sp.]
MKSAPTIAFDIAPSRRLAALALVIVLLAVIAVVLSGFAFAVRLAVAMAVVAAGAHALKRFLEPGYRRVARDSSGWQLVSDGGDALPATLVGYSRLGPFLVLEFLLGPDRRYRCVLTPDVIDADVRRRLLLILATEPHAAR